MFLNSTNCIAPCTQHAPMTSIVHVTMEWLWTWCYFFAFDLALDFEAVFFADFVAVCFLPDALLWPPYLVAKLSKNASICLPRDCWLWSISADKLQLSSVFDSFFLACSASLLSASACKMPNTILFAHNKHVHSLHEKVKNAIKLPKTSVKNTKIKIYIV